MTVMRLDNLFVVLHRLGFSSDRAALKTGNLKPMHGMEPMHHCHIIRASDYHIHAKSKADTNLTYMNGSIFIDLEYTWRSTHM